MMERDVGRLEGQLKEINKKLDTLEERFNDHLANHHGQHKRSIKSTGAMVGLGAILIGVIVALVEIVRVLVT